MPTQLLRAALDAAAAGLFVFPVAPRGKTPAVRGWERAATLDPARIDAWWQARPYNLGLACGPSGLLVVDLDHGRGELPPPAWAGARHGRDVLAQLARAAGQPVPTGTYTVATPGGGEHLYFRSPPEVELRNTAGILGWRIDTRGHGGYVVGAGSVRDEGCYRVARPGSIAPLPAWLARALRPPTGPPDPVAPLLLPDARADAYATAIVEREAHDVAVAEPGTRHVTLLRAARTLGRLVGGGELDEARAVDTLHRAAAHQIGVAGTTEHEITRCVADGIAYGKQAPRRIRSGRAHPPA